MIGYKICRTCYGGGYVNGFCLVTLDVPSNAKVIAPYGTNKLRCDFANIVDMRRIGLVKYDFGLFEKYKVVKKTASPQVDFAVNLFTDYRITSYVRCDEIRADWLDDNPHAECSHGIGFFATKNEAYDFLLKFARTGSFQPTEVVCGGVRGIFSYMINMLIGKEYG